MPVLTSLEPVRVVEGGRLWLRGDGFPSPESTTDVVTIGGVSARMSFAASDRLAVVVPTGLDGGETPVKVAWLPGATLYARVGTVLATGLHQVDNPVFDANGNLYVTYSGTRGQEATVSIFRVAPGGAQQLYNITPDLTTLGKVIGGGLPIAAYGGRKDIMTFIAPSGPIYQAEIGRAHV